MIKALPLTALNDALRASILEGTPLFHQWPQLLVVGLWGGVSFALALHGFAGLRRILSSRSLGLVRKFWEKLRTRPSAVFAK